MPACLSPGPWSFPGKDLPEKKKGPSLAGAALFLCERSTGDQFFSLRAFRASPRMSPSDAPESDEPYWATAFFSSEI